MSIEYISVDVPYSDSAQDPHNVRTDLLPIGKRRQVLRHDSPDQLRSCRCLVAAQPDEGLAHVLAVCVSSFVIVDGPMNPGLDT